MNTSTRVSIFAAMLLAAFVGGWVSKGWKEDSSRLSQLNSGIVAAWTLQSDLNAALLKLAEAREAQKAKFMKVDEGYAKYLSNPNRDRTRFSDERVQFKNSAVEAANSISRPKD